MICFDFDGVLADSLSAWEEACSHAARQMGASAPLHPYAKLNPLSHYEVGKSLGLEPRTFEHLASEFFITQKLDSINLFAGSIDMLKRLSEQFRLCIISASEEQIVKSILQKHNALTYFAHLYCGNTPKSETLKKYADKDSIMIGDGISDMQAAKIAQVYGIGVLWGWQDKDMLIESSVLVENHAQLLEAIFRFYAARFYKI